MKLSILLAGSILTSAIVGNVYPILTALKKPTLWPNCRPTSSLPPCLIIPGLSPEIKDSNIRHPLMDLLLAMIVI